MKHSYIDEYSYSKSFLCSLDPRVKIVAFFGFIFFVILTRPDSFSSFLLYALMVAVLVAVSGVPVLYVLKRSLVVFPFVIAIAVFIPFFKKGEIAGGYSLGQMHLVVTYDGLLILWNVVAKSYLSILCMILLMTTTNFKDLTRGLAKLRVPHIIIILMSFMYRYVFVLYDQLLEMSLAKDSRTVKGSSWMDLRIFSNMLGVLFIRAYERAENVYIAMCSRGFNGTIKTLDEFRIRARDLFFLTTVFLALLSVKILGR